MPQLGDIDKLERELVPSQKKEPFLILDMGGGLHQRHRGVDKDDDQLFDSDSFLSNSDDDGDSEEEATTSSSPDASSPTSLTANTNPNGALYQLSALMEHLPVKRGLSKYYQGKSQSYISLSAVSSVEDLPKKEIPYKRKMIKACKSYAGGLDASKRSAPAPRPCSKGKAIPKSHPG